MNWHDRPVPRLVLDEKGGEVVMIKFLSDRSDIRKKFNVMIAIFSIFHFLLKQTVILNVNIKQIFTLNT